MADTLWIGTRKGLFALRRQTRGWRLTGPQFLGHVIHHVVQDPRDCKRVVMAAKTGHLGPTIYHSADRGRTWQESRRPPAFAKAADGEQGRAVQTTFWVTPGHASEPGTWYCGTAPPGLFRSEDHGATWEGVSGFNDHPMYRQWAAGLASPGGELLHSILVDPRDPRHLYVSISVGGTFESTDGGRDWVPLNSGIIMDYSPEPEAPWGQDPHCVVLHPKFPDRLYQQNHCGIYRLDRPQNRWVRIGDHMPRKIRDIGFPIVLHAQDPDVAWVLPMDGTAVWPRTSVEGKPAVYRTTNGGRSWQRQDRGLPRSQAWWTVLRQAMCRDEGPGPGLYFGTTSGEV
ncbi:MAG: hypothetical protein NZM12_02340, partial [Steroidobacteraceae bacterium]|nr:hypothetical protein [Steroidobacteraceae bacterium]MDW8258691.1 glycosyl hydrolase [Gammaproteobacteria bacterium]